jgi:hypothetical protein
VIGKGLDQQLHGVIGVRGWEQHLYCVTPFGCAFCSGTGGLLSELMA